MITVYQSKKFMYHKEGYTKVATVDTDSIAEAFRLTQNIDGSWSQGPELSYDGKTYANKDFSDKVTVLTDLETYNGEVVGLRSTSSGDVLFDGENYWFLVPSYGDRNATESYKTRGQTVAIDNFDINGFEYDDKEVA